MTCVWLTEATTPFTPFPAATTAARPHYFRSLCWKILMIDRPDDHALQDISGFPFFAIPLSAWGCWLHLQAIPPYRILRWVHRDGTLTLYGWTQPMIVDDQGANGVLLQLTGYGDQFHWLIVRDPGKSLEPVLLRVPACRTVQEAKAWTFNLHPSVYHPEIET